MKKAILLVLFSFVVTFGILLGQSARICPVSETVNGSQTQYYFEASFYFAFAGQPVISWTVTNGTIIQQNTNPSFGSVYAIVLASNSVQPIISITAKDANGMIQNGAYKLLWFGPPVSWVKPMSQSIFRFQQLCTLWGNLTESGNTYQWQQQETSSGVNAPDDNNWEDILGEVNASYTPITSGTANNRWFRRITVSNGEIYYSTPSAIFPSIFTPGAIVTSNTVVPYNTAPTITATYAGGGLYTPTLDYYWQKSSGNGVWTTIGGTTPYYPNVPITGTTIIRRAYTDRSGTYYSNELTFTTTYISPNYENLNYVRELTVLKKGVTSWEEADFLSVGDKLQSTTYLDGLGRPVQSIERGVSPSTGGVWKDIVKHYEYDAAGRTTKDFLAYATAEYPDKFKPNAATAQPTYIRNFFAEPSTSPTHSVIQYDESPLNRVMKSMAAGQSWAGSNIGVSASYDFNKSAENVHLWTLDFSASAIPVTSPTQKYAEGKLSKITSFDENLNKVITYTDLSGNIILKKVQETTTALLTQAHNGWVCTYYVYDDFGLLRFIITPKAIKYLDENGWNLTQNIIDELCFRYQYDEKGRTIIKKQPGAGEQVVVYDKKDRPVLSQDANQKAKGQWSFSLYDDVHRVVATGLFDNTGDRVTMQNHANTNLNSGLVSISVFVGNGTYQNISVDNPIAGSSGTSNYCNGCNAATLTYNSITHFDNYNYAGVKSFNTNNNLAFSNTDIPDPTEKTNRTTGFVTGEKIRVLDSDNNPFNDKFLYSTAYYDEPGRSLQNLADNIKTGGSDYQTNQYDFSSKLLSTYTNHNNGTSVYTVTSKNVFDKIGRLTQFYKSFNSSVYKQLAEYAYDELGQLKTKRLAPGYTATGKNEIESFTYDYNIQGWLTGINKDYALSDNNYSQWDKYFGMYLGYDNGTNPLYNGNISSTIWKSQGDNSPRKYDYTYDRLDRFTSALFTQKKRPADSWSNTEVDFSVYMEYEDGNGNIKSMKHMGVVPGVNNGVIVDDLRYSYKPVPGMSGLNGNKLIKVDDPFNSLGGNNGLLGDFKDGGNSGEDYEYDENGNLVKDFNKNIVNGATNGVVYNFLNKPEKIIITGKSTIEFTYDASGEKVKKKITYADNSVRNTTYIGGFIYEQFIPAGGPAGNDDLQFVLHEEGRVKIITPHSPVNAIDYELSAGGLDIAWPGGKQGTFEYFVKDHLGSTRMVLTEEVQKEFYLATMELSAQSIEAPLFGAVLSNGNPDPSNNEWIKTRMDNSPWPGNNGGVAKLTATNSGTKIGPNMIMKVMAGDIINTQVNYFYINNNSTGGGNPVNSILTSLVGALSVPKTGTLSHNNSGLVNTSLTNNFPFTQFVNNQPNVGNPNAPKAYLTVIFLDEQFRFVDKDNVTPDVGSDFRRVEFANTPNSLLWMQKKAPKNGWVFVYLSNESNENVYFDNLAVNQEHSRIAEESHYYPYGLKIAGISSKAFNKLQNKYGYQGDFSVEEPETGWNEFDLRMYDPQIGRWNATDPIGEFASPFVGMGNNPISSIDPSGGKIDQWLYNTETDQYEWFDEVNDFSDFLYGGYGLKGYEYHFDKVNGDFWHQFAGRMQYYTKDGALDPGTLLLGVTVDNIRTPQQELKKFLKEGGDFKDFLRGAKDRAVQILKFWEWVDLKMPTKDELEYQVVIQVIAFGKNDPSEAFYKADQKNGTNLFSKYLEVMSVIQLNIPNNGPSTSYKIGGGAVDVALVLTPFKLKGVKTSVSPGIQANKAAGDAFRDNLAGLLRAEGKTVYTEVYKSTPIGARYIDLDVWQNGVNLGGIEAKVGRSRYHVLQRMKDNYLYYNSKYRVDLVRKPK